MIVWCISNWESYPFHLCFHMAMMWVGIHTWSTPVYLNTWTYFPACAYDCSAVYLWLTVHWAGTQPPLPEGPEPAWWPPQLSKPGRARWWPSLPRKEAEADLDVNANEGLAAHLASAVDAASRGRWESHSSWTVLSCKAHSPSPAHFFFLSLRCTHSKDWSGIQNADWMRHSPLRSWPAPAMNHITMD